MSNLDDHLHSIEEILPRLHQAYYRLALIIGKPGTGKTRLLQLLSEQSRYPVFNVNLQIGERLLEHTIAERPRLVPRMLGEIIKEAHSPTVLLDNMEMLFDATLQLNPLQILQSLSRNVTIVAAWSGTYTDGSLFYAEAWHPEYRRYPLAPQDAVIVQLD